MDIAWEYAYIYALIGINLCICIYLCSSDNILSKAYNYAYPYNYAFYKELVWKRNMVLKDLDEQLSYTNGSGDRLWNSHY